MDELTFDQNTPNTDTTQNIEGYEDQVEQIQNAYPKEDFRTPAEIQAEQQQAQMMQAAQTFGPQVIDAMAQQAVQPPIDEA